MQTGMDTERSGDQMTEDSAGQGKHEKCLGTERNHRVCRQEAGDTEKQTGRGGRKAWAMRDKVENIHLRR